MASAHRLSASVGGIKYKRPDTDSASDCKSPRFCVPFLRLSCFETADFALIVMHLFLGERTHSHSFGLNKAEYLYYVS